MTTTYWILIIIHFIGSGFMCGQLYESDIKDMFKWTSIRSVIGVPLLLLLILAVGIEFHILLLTWGLILNTIRYLGKLTQIQFYFRFYVLKDWKNVPDQHLKNMDMQWFHFKAQKELPLTTRHFLHTMEMMNKKLLRTPKNRKQWSDIDRENDRKKHQEKILAEYERVGYDMALLEVKKIPTCPSCGCYRGPKHEKTDYCGYCGFNESLPEQDQ